MLDAAYPPETAQQWDAVGLVCGDPAAPVRTVLLAVDPVTEVVDEAIEAKADLLVVHHPLLLRPVHSVATTTPKGRAVHRLIEAGCALYVAHTNADTARPGVSDALARMLGLDDLRPLVPTPGDDRFSVTTTATQAGVHDVLDAAVRAGAVGICDGRSPGQAPDAPARLVVEVEHAALDRVVAAVRAAGPDPDVHIDVHRLEVSGTGIGRVGTLTEPTTLERFALAVAEALPHTPQGVRVSGDPDAVVRTVAVCGGSGDDLFDAVRASGADVFLTADLRHHPASEAPEGLALLDAAHWATEWPWLVDAARRLTSATNVETVVSTLVTDPWTHSARSPHA